jgi:hypothetical protein
MATWRTALFASLALTASAIPALVATPAHAGGWQEWHQTGNDLFVTMDRDGKAHVEHHVRYRVVAGKMQSFDLPAIDLEAQVTPEVSLVTEDGTRLGAHAEGISAKAAKDIPDLDPGTQVVRVSVDDPKGLKRGVYAFVVAYDVDAWKTKHLSKDGSLMRVSFKFPPSLEGRDAARAVFRLPPAPTEPRVLVRDDGSEGEGTALVTLRRSPEVDEIELVRAHVSRGETVTWAVRADTKAFTTKGAPAENEAPRGAAIVGPKSRGRAAALAAAALFAGLALGALFARKQRAFRLEVARAGLSPRPLLPLPGAARPPVFSLLFAAGLAVAVLSSPLGGTALLLAAMTVLVDLRPKKMGFRVRGPGEWKPLADGGKSREKVRIVSPWLDATGRRGLAAYVAMVLVALGLGTLGEAFFPGIRLLAPLAAASLAPLFFSGVSGQLPASASGRTVGFLGGLEARIAKRKELRAKLYGRVPTGESKWDEARLRALPRGAMPGVRGVEVGVVDARTLTGFLPTAEVLVRVFDGSPAHARLESLSDDVLGRRVALPGRETDEKVIRLAPAAAEPKEVEALLVTLAGELHDRRNAKPSKGYAGRDRRAARRNQKDTGRALAV